VILGAGFMIVLLDVGCSIPSQNTIWEGENHHEC